MQTAISRDYPPIAPVPEGVERPVWSVMIPTYNCAHYLRETLTSVLAQDPGLASMHIEVVDDCSSKDDPEAVVAELGRGRVRFFRQPGNVGAIANFNTCIRRSVGQLVHILHGDDLVMDGFYRRLGDALLNHSDVGAAFCRHIYIDANSQRRLTTRLDQPFSGVLSDALGRLAVANRIQPPAIVIKRQVYETLGGFNPRLPHAADWELWVRIASRYLVWYETEPLAAYRTHSSSDTSRLFLTGFNIQDRRQAIIEYQRYLPPHRVNELTRKALAYSAVYATRTAFRFFRLGKWRPTVIQLKEAVVCLWKLAQPISVPENSGQL